MRLAGMLPPEAVSGRARLVLWGRERLLVEQHGGVLAYDLQSISLRVGEGQLRVAGHDLRIREYSRQDISITGRVDALVFDGACE